MRARHLAVIVTTLACGSALYACSTTPGGPLGLIDRDDAEPPSETGAGSDTSTADTSTPADASEGSAPGTDADADTGAPAADSATADEPDGS